MQQNYIFNSEELKVSGILLLLLLLLFITFMLGIYNYTTKTKHVSGVCNFAAIL
jgi:hypothetical protein